MIIWDSYTINCTTKEPFQLITPFLWGLFDLQGREAPNINVPLKHTFFFYLSLLLFMGYSTFSRGHSHQTSFPPIIIADDCLCYFLLVNLFINMSFSSVSRGLFPQTPLRPLIIGRKFFLFCKCYQCVSILLFEGLESQSRLGTDTYWRQSKIVNR